MKKKSFAIYTPIEGNRERVKQRKKAREKCKEDEKKS